MLLTQSEWARQKGFSRQYAAKLIKQGTIRLTGGKVDKVQAEAALAALREPLRQTSSEEPLESGGQNLSTLLLKSRIKTEVERGRLLEAKAKAETGKLVSADEVKIAAFRRARIVRDGLLNLPDRLAALLAAEHDATKVHTLLTTEIRTVLVELGETWVDRGEAPDWQRLYERRENYPLGIIPTSGLLLTAGADVQKDRIEVEVVAWGKGKESWSVDYRVLYGDPAQEKIWQQLQTLLAEPFRHASGVDLSIRALAVDTGFATQDVYAWCRKQEAGRVLAVKGVERAIAPVGAPTAVDVNIGGKRLRRGIKVWPVGVSLLKSELYQWLKLQRGEDSQFPSGYCHFPQYEAEYFGIMEKKGGC